jgi:hypothetical protein
MALRRRAQTAANRRREAAQANADAATRAANAKAGEALQPADLEGLTAAQKVSAVSGGYLDHLPTPQLARDDLAGLTPDEIVAARRAGMTEGVQGKR